MKLIKAYFTEVLVISTTFVLCVQQNALAGGASQAVTRSQAQQLSRDLVQPESQRFFSQGKEWFDREIQILLERRLSSTTPILKTDKLPQSEEDRNSGPIPPPN